MCHQKQESVMKIFCSIQQISILFLFRVIIIFLLAFFIIPGKSRFSAIKKDTHTVNINAFDIHKENIDDRFL